MLNLTVDGETYEVKEGLNVLEACLSLGLDLPYFCWHPAMGSVGACRQCAVLQFADDQDQRGRLVMGCMTPVADGMHISISQEQAKRFRGQVIEMLMTNHPHDCPVCEEGGECHLQDMTEMSGHTNRRYRGTKRTHRNQFLGPFVKHEMNRCIACYRCVRFYRDYAGGDDLNVFSSHNHVYFGREKDGELESPFSGNLVEVCPTGVFTDKVFSRSYSRKWDLQTAPSICGHCSTGCNTVPGERYGRVRRIVNRYNAEVNGYFLCDRGRFGFEYVNDSNRAIKPTLKRKSLSNEEALDYLREVSFRGQSLFAIGSPRSSLENNYALKHWVGEGNFHSGFADNEMVMMKTGLNILSEGYLRPSIKAIENSDAIVIFGEDLMASAPRLALAVRQAVGAKRQVEAEKEQIPPWQDAAVRTYSQNAKHPLYLFSLQNTELDNLATEVNILTPQAIRAATTLLAAIIDPGEIDHIDPLREEFVEEHGDALYQQLVDLAEILTTAKEPLIITGVNHFSEALINSVGELSAALKQVREDSNVNLCVIPKQANGMGQAILTHEDNLTFPELIGDLRADKLAEKETTLVVLENDLSRIMSAAQLQELRDLVDNLVVIEHCENTINEVADLHLPSASVFESQGTYINYEARAQRSFSVVNTPEGMQPAWQWIDALLNDRWQYTDSVTAACAADHPVLQDIVLAAPDRTFRKAGMEIARQSHRYSGRTAMNADKSVSETASQKDPDTPFSFSMEGAKPNGLPPALIGSAWAPGWNSNQSNHKLQQEMMGLGGRGDAYLGVKLFLELPNQSVDEVLQLKESDIEGGYTILPRLEIFGGEELSSKGESVSARSTLPYLFINAREAEKLALRDFDSAEIMVDGKPIVLFVQIDDALPHGLVMISESILQTHFIPFGESLVVEKAKRQLPRPPTLIPIVDGDAHVS